MEADGQDSGTVAGRGGQRYKVLLRSWKEMSVQLQPVHVFSLSPFSTMALVGLCVPFLVPTVRIPSLPLPQYPCLHPRADERAAGTGSGTWVEKGWLQGAGGVVVVEGGLGPASRHHTYCAHCPGWGSVWGCRTGAMPGRLSHLPSRTEGPWPAAADSLCRELLALTRELYSSHGSLCNERRRGLAGASSVTGQLLPGLLSSPARGGVPKSLPVNFL